MYINNIYLETLRYANARIAVLELYEILKLRVSCIFMKELTVEQ